MVADPDEISDDEISDDEVMAGPLIAIMNRVKEFSVRSGLDVRSEIFEDLTDEQWEEIQRAVGMAEEVMKARAQGVRKTPGVASEGS